MTLSTFGFGGYSISTFGLGEISGGTDYVFPEIIYLDVNVMIQYDINKCISV